MNRSPDNASRFIVIISLLASLSATTAQAAQYEWTFSQGNLSPALGNGTMSYADGSTAGLTTFGVTDGTTVSHINGQPASYIHFPSFNALGNGYNLTFTDSGPNGGGAYLNQYTMVYDLYVPGAVNQYIAQFNTDPDNTSGNDADFYIGDDGSLGIGNGGYSAPGTIAGNTWYRIGFAADLQANTLSFYVNGTLVKQNTGSGLLNGRWSLYSNADAGADLRLFNEGDTSGNYTHELYVNSLYFTDRTLSGAEMAGLGGPNAIGIVAVPEPGSWALVGLGTLLFASLRRRQRR
jgi:hypothetical protein